MDLTSTSTIRKLRWLFCLTAFFIFTTSYAFDTKRFDAPPPKRPGYLSFTSPQKLRFAPAPIVADRSSLILPMTITISTENDSGDANASLKEIEFPVNDYADSPAGDSEIDDARELEIPKIAPPIELPMADPFAGGNSDAINSTDELMKVFDQSRIEVGNSRIAIPFVPPYTVAPESMKISSRSTYRRVNR